MMLQEKKHDKKTILYSKTIKEIMHKMTNVSNKLLTLKYLPLTNIEIIVDLTNL